MGVGHFPGVRLVVQCSGGSGRIMGAICEGMTGFCFQVGRVFGGILAKEGRDPVRHLGRISQLFSLFLFFFSLPLPWGVCGADRSLLCMTLPEGGGEPDGCRCRLPLMKMTAGRRAEQRREERRRSPILRCVNAQGR